MCLGAATYKLTFGGRVIARGDLLLYFYPLRDFASAAIRTARLPLWNPYTFMGAPFLANSQAGFFYPLNIMLAWTPAPQAVSWSIALHLIIAALGMLAFGRVALRLGWVAGCAAALTLGLGGYLGAQVEHLNQLQVLAWLPGQLGLVGWLHRHFSNSDQTDHAGRQGDTAMVARTRLSALCALTIVFVLQITAGHTQALYISLFAVGITGTLATAQAVAVRMRLPTTRQKLAPLGAPAIIAAAGLLAVVVCAAQLLPTFELAQYSARSGGLPFNEVASFSWRPWVIARALMPTYGDPLFPEYAAYLGAVGIALAILGALPVFRGESSAQNAGFWRWLALTLCLGGILLALGSATPLFNMLFRWLPGFAFFRAQARWLVLFAVGASTLVGFGVQRLVNNPPRRVLGIWLLTYVMAAVVWSVILLVGARLSPEQEYRGLPARDVILGWATAALITLVAIAVSLIAAGRRHGPTQERVASGANFPMAGVGFTVLLSVELLIASQFQPYARASDAQAVDELRPATAHLLVQKQFAPSNAFGRVLALSSLNFDPGDRPEQELSYGLSLNNDERYDRVIAAKQKEILSPNLSLMYRIPSVDGYDGGLLPLRDYANFVRPLTERPGDRRAASADGRLREFLDGVPSKGWLDKMSVRYLVADKTADVFVEDVYYDTLFHAALTDTVTLTLMPYQGTALGLLTDDQAPMHMIITFADGTLMETIVTPVAFTAPNTGRTYGYVRLNFPGRNTPTAIVLTAGQNLISVSSIDAADRTFLTQQVVGEHNMRLIYSGDVKIYENLSATPRVQVFAGSQDISNALIVSDDEPELLAIRLRDMTVAGTVVIHDACYPGWVARVDGVVAEASCGEMQRVVTLPAGSRELLFTYEPASVRMGLVFSVIGIVILILLGAALVFHRRPNVA